MGWRRARGARSRLLPAADRLKSAVMRERRSSERLPMVAPVEVVTRERTDLDPQLAKLHVPGLAAGIIKNGELACASAAGMADIAAGRPVTPDTLFLLASTSKTVTATALMSLDDKFSLDDAASSHLPFQ